MSSVIGENRGPISGLPGPQNLRMGGGAPRMYQTTGDDFGRQGFNDIYNLGQAEQKFFNMTMGLSIENDHQKQSNLATKQALLYDQEKAHKIAELSQKRGFNARDLEKEYQDWDAEARVRFGEGINGGLASELYTKHTDKSYTTGRAQISQRQIEEGINETFQMMDAKKGAIFQAAKDDPRSIPLRMQEMATANQQQADALGWSPQYARFKLQTDWEALGDTTLQAGIAKYGYDWVEGWAESKEGLELRAKIGDTRFNANLGKTVAIARSESKARRVSMYENFIADKVMLAYKNGDDLSKLSVELRQWAVANNIHDMVTPSFVRQVMANTITSEQWVRGLDSEQRKEFVKNGVIEQVYSGMTTRDALDRVNQLRADPNADPVDLEIAVNTLAGLTAIEESVAKGLTAADKKLVQDVVNNDQTGAMETARQAGDYTVFAQAATMQMESILGRELKPNETAALWEYIKTVDFGDRAKDHGQVFQTDRLQKEINRIRADRENEEYKAADAAEAIIDKYGKNWGTPGATQDYLNDPELQNLPPKTRQRTISRLNALFKAAQSSMKAGWLEADGRYTDNPDAFAAIYAEEGGPAKLIAEVGPSNFRRLERDMRKLSNTAADNTRSALVGQIKGAMDSSLAFLANGTQEQKDTANIIKARVLGDFNVAFAGIIQTDNTGSKVDDRITSQLMTRAINLAEVAAAHASSVDTLRSYYTDPTMTSSETWATLAETDRATYDRFSQFHVYNPQFSAADQQKFQQYVGQGRMLLLYGNTQGSFAAEGTGQVAVKPAGMTDEVYRRTLREYRAMDEDTFAWMWLSGRTIFAPPAGVDTKSIPNLVAGNEVAMDSSSFVRVGYDQDAARVIDPFSLPANVLSNLDSVSSPGGTDWRLGKAMINGDKGQYWVQARTGSRQTLTRVYSQDGRFIQEF